MKPCEYERVATGIYVFTGDFQWETLFKFLGYDWDKTDPAHPEDMMRKEWFRNRVESRDHPFWYYGGNDRIFGEPIWSDDLIKEMCLKLYPAIVKKFFEHNMWDGNIYPSNECFGQMSKNNPKCNECHDWGYCGDVTEAAKKIKPKMQIDEEFRQYLIDEYHECLIKINTWDAACQDRSTLDWWVGNRDRIEMLSEYFRKVGVDIKQIPSTSRDREFPHYENMSPKVQGRFIVNINVVSECCGILTSTR